VTDTGEEPAGVTVKSSLPDAEASAWTSAGAETDNRIYLDERNGEAHAQLIAAAPALARAYYKLLACYIPPRGR
jgi:hypothetical protein